jgi:ppGpp synthetase/RelA/SpoT-type nucleotidyltranferase
MSFPPKPDISKSKINEAGIVLSSGKPGTDEYDHALVVVNDFRKSHAYPINTFRATLTAKTRSGYGKPIVAQRLKRLPTIVNKLQRYPEMQLSRMQDIAGLRVVLKDMSAVNKLVGEYHASRLEHELVKSRDYITDPRGEDGYRSHHLIYKYVNNRGDAAQYNGLFIEVQVRTKLQHTWATTVETMGVILDQALKAREGDQEWLHFFALVSSYFAHKERTPPVPGYDKLSVEEMKKLIVSEAKRLQVIDKIRGFSKAMEVITETSNRNSTYYHLIVLDTISKKVSINSYARSEFERASNDLIAEEKKTSTSGGKLDTVLVAAGPINDLKRAYPNYFLDNSDFVREIESIIRDLS